MAAARGHKASVDQLLAHVPPPGAEYLWQWFVDLHMARASGSFGPGAISFPDIKAWLDLNQIRATPWDIETIRMIDAEYLSHVSETAKVERNRRAKVKPKQNG